MKVVLIFIMAGIFLMGIFLPLVHAADSQTIIACGGDEQTIIACNAGDIQNSPTSYVPEIASTTEVNHGGSIQNIQSSGFYERHQFLILLLLLALLASIIFFIIFFYKRRRKDEE